VAKRATPRPAEVSFKTAMLHGREIGYLGCGKGPVLLLVHGMAGTCENWRDVIEPLARHHTVIAPDLPGHGLSAPGPGDYSLGNLASGLRDLLLVLGHERATLVGHSLGGGIAMQLAYQHPERCERLVLVGAGGLGAEVMPLLRAMTAPGAEYVLPVAFAPFIRTSVETVAGWAGRIGLQPSPSTIEMWRAYTSLIDADTRAAFLDTLRAVVDVHGQRVSAHDRLYLARKLPALVVCGEDDAVMLVGPACEAHDAMPDSRLEVLPGCGHFAHCEDPRRFAAILLDFMATTDPAHLRPEDLAPLLTAS
jgi:pimeloyl-ACP methyl ester carboxylesterase